MNPCLTLLLLNHMTRDTTDAQVVGSDWEPPHTRCVCDVRHCSQNLVSHPSLSHTSSEEARNLVSWVVVGLKLSHSGGNAF